jgi:hypothetical protein
MIIPSPDGVKESAKRDRHIFLWGLSLSVLLLRKGGAVPFLKEKMVCPFFLLFLVFSDEKKYNPPQK